MYFADADHAQTRNNAQRECTMLAEINNYVGSNYRFPSPAAPRTTMMTTKTTGIDSTTSNNSGSNNGEDAFDSAFDAFPGEENKVETTNATGDGGDDDPFSSFGDF